MKSTEKRRVPLYGLLLLSTAMLLLGAAALIVWLPYHREQLLIDEIDFKGVAMRQGGPEWLRRYLGDHVMEIFDRAWSVGLEETDVSDDELNDVLRTMDLTELGLGNTQITDAGLACLGCQTGLEFLNLNNTQITDESLKHVSSLKKLNNLGLSGTQITDVGVSHLALNTELVMLDLDDTQVTDAALIHLAGLSKLEDLSLWGTQVTKEGVARLKTELPDCKIRVFFPYERNPLQEL